MAPLNTLNSRVRVMDSNLCSSCGKADIVKEDMCMSCWRVSIWGDKIPDFAVPNITSKGKNYLQELYEEWSQEEYCAGWMSGAYEQDGFFKWIKHHLNELEEELYGDFV